MTTPVLSAQVLCGLGFGDEGKGTMTDFLCRFRQASLVVRYNGGSQAAHNVVTDDGRHHTFAQVGSGAFIPGVRTLLSRFMLWDPIALAHEAAVLSPKLGYHALDHHFIDYRAPVITPFHVAANHLKEWLRGNDRHGSCGKGIGETASDLVHFPDEVIRAGDCLNRHKLASLLGSIQARKREEILQALSDQILPRAMEKMFALLDDSREPQQIADAYATMAKAFKIIAERQVNWMINHSISIFEGAQGVLLDEWHGFHPYTTWSTTTPCHAMQILKEAEYKGEVEITGVLRSYMTRHGAGPLPTEDRKLNGLSPNEHNERGRWQGAMRYGAFDGVLLRYALECATKGAAMTSLALTHLDAFARQAGIPFCDEYLFPFPVSEDEVRVRGQCGDSSARMLRPNFEQDLAHQENLARLLQSAEPVQSGSFGNFDQLARYLQQNTNVPIRYGSFGPRTQDKRIFT
jgi:adenylosuccinate synthase